MGPDLLFRQKCLNYFYVILLCTEIHTVVFVYCFEMDIFRLIYIMFREGFDFIQHILTRICIRTSKIARSFNALHLGEI